MGALCRAKLGPAHGGNRDRGNRGVIGDRPRNGGNRGQTTKSRKSEPCRCTVLDPCGCLTAYCGPGNGVFGGRLLADTASSRVPFAVALAGTSQSLRGQPTRGCKALLTVGAAASTGAECTCSYCPCLAPRWLGFVSLEVVEVGMRLADRLVWALLVILVDAAAFAVPLAALLLAYVLLARPPWFRDWVEQLYRDDPP